jgi:glycosyltransferase involved in cell wall biosynthesis
LPSGDVEALAGALRTLVENAELRERLGRAARKTAVERFSRERYAREILDVYRALVRGGGAP